MYDAGRDEVAEVVSLEVQRIAEASVLARAYGGAYVLVLLFLVLYGFLVHLGDNYGRMQVSVGLLCLCDEADHVVHDFV